MLRLKYESQEISLELERDWLLLRGQDMTLLLRKEAVVGFALKVGVNWGYFLLGVALLAAGAGLWIFLSERLFAVLVGILGVASVVFASIYPPAQILVYGTGIPAIPLKTTAKYETLKSTLDRLKAWREM